MSKYVKLEDAIHNINLEVTGRKEYTGDMKANLFFALDDLPTIEVSEDAISREDAVNALIAHFIPQTYTGEQVEQASKLAWKIMANAPSVIPSRAEGEWIPCNERLPERDGCYLATLHIKWPDREYKTVEVEEFRNGGFNERSYARVAAWMPLPEPWKGADNV